MLPLAAFALVTLISFVRMPGIAADTLWAEDLNVFLRSELREGFVNPFLPYQGYLHVIPRLVASGVAAIAPAHAFGLVMSMLSCAVAGLIGLGLYLCSRDLIRHRSLRFMLALVPALVPVLPLEASGNIANLHWYCFALAPWLFMFRPKRWSGAAVAAIAALAVTLTEPACVIFLPLLLIGIRDRRRWPLAGAALAGSAAQVIVAATNPRVVTDYGVRLSPLDIVTGYAFEPLIGTWTWRTQGFGRRVVDGSDLWLFIAIVVGVIAVVGMALWLGRWKRSFLLLALAIGSAASWASSVMFNAIPAYAFAADLPQALTDYTTWRYLAAPAMCIAAGLILAADILLSARLRTVPNAIVNVLALGTVASLLIGFSAGYVVDPHLSSRTTSPAWSPQAHEAVNDCAEGSTEFTFRIPPGWDLTFSCENLGL